MTGQIECCILRTDGALPPGRRFLIDNSYALVHGLFVSMTLPAPGLARLTQSFALILGGLCDAVAARMSKPHTRQQQAAFPLLMLLWGRLCRTMRRFAALTANPGAAGAAPPRNPAEPRTVKPSERKPLPSGFGWVVKLLPEAAVFGCQLQHFLTDPEMAALIAANPKIAGLLRPLCRMLAVPGPPRPTPVRAAQAAPPPQSASPDPDGDRPESCNGNPAPQPSDLLAPVLPRDVLPHDVLPHDVLPPKDCIFAPS